MSKTLKCILIILVILVIDQVLKIIVKTNMTLYEQIPVFGNWFMIHFVENKGMAFGLHLPGNNGKMFLSLFRLVAIIAIGFYLRHLIKIGAPSGLLITLSMIMAGALGNMIDSAFYGMIFSESNTIMPAEMFPPNGGYERIMHGKVVDMFYFPVLSGVYPDWIPWIGGQSFTFFRPVFNIADASITIAVVILLFRQRHYFAFLHEEEEKEKAAEKEKAKTEEEKAQSAEGKSTAAEGKSTAAEGKSTAAEEKSATTDEKTKKAGKKTITSEEKPPALDQEDSSKD